MATVSSSRSGSASSDRRPGSGSGSSTTKHLEPPTPYETTAFMTNASPLLTSSLHSRNSASSIQESAYLAKAQVLQWSRLGLAVLVIASATAALGCAGHVLDRYNETAGVGKPYHLPQLWPANVDVRPTLAVLIPAAIVITVNLGYVVFSLIPTPYSRTLMYNFVFLASSLAGLVLCLFAIPFSTTLTDPSAHHSRESLHSWTCKFSDGAASFTSNAKALQIPVYLSAGVPVPAGFKRLCKESQVGVGLMATVMVLEAVSCAVAGAGILLEKRIAKARKARYAAAAGHDEKRETLS
ncbi:hypothetical protein PV08_03093 [Exophiala spinifera]|uniref:Uncharacterized protein n=1 Tax=Exophiala spinifera TaxID=91928 RepID=A0A0D2C5D3_9EURO|nr:uncharacterized protein PV08_03093 [Exophiala spinifera]KIW18804.1 hypothetical protein PV08_03093 [Exophiala spinifera]